MLFNHFILCHSLLLLISVLPSIRVFSSELALRIRWPKYWSFSFCISLSNEYSGWISFRTDWFDDLLAVQGTFKSLLQNHSSEAPILQCSASLWSRSHIHTWLLGNQSCDYTDLCWQSYFSAFNTLSGFVTAAVRKPHMRSTVKIRELTKVRSKALKSLSG